jgi:hypothetical protein
MTRQTVLGSLFVALGVVIMFVMLAPMAVAAIHGTAVTITVLALALLAIGIGVALFGAWLIPASGAPVAFQQLTIALSNSSLPFVGKDRRGNGPSITATVTSAVAEPPVKEMEFPPPEKRG